MFLLFFIGVERERGGGEILEFFKVKRLMLVSISGYLS
jgi:hypothetical protein